MSDPQLYLDGFRDGLGAAIRQLDAIRDMASHPCIHHALAGSADGATAAEVVAATLRGVATGLRMLSVSVRLDSDGV